VLKDKEVVVAVAVVAAAVVVAVVVVAVVIVVVVVVVVVVVEVVVLIPSDYHLHPFYLCQCFSADSGNMKLVGGNPWDDYLYEGKLGEVRQEEGEEIEEQSHFTLLF